VLEGAVAITGDLLEALPIGGVQEDADCLGHRPRIASFLSRVNPLFASMQAVEKRPAGPKPCTGGISPTIRSSRLTRAACMGERIC
jgi:hypothetical protein